MRKIRKTPSKDEMDEIWLELLEEFRSLIAAQDETISKLKSALAARENDIAEHNRSIVELRAQWIAAYA